MNADQHAVDGDRIFLIGLAMFITTTIGFVCGFAYHMQRVEAQATSGYAVKMICSPVEVSK